MLNTKLKPKNVSDAYILFSLLADHEGCKARLDELVAAEDTAVKEQEKAAEDKRHAEVEMSKMTSQLTALRGEEDKISDQWSMLDQERIKLNELVNSHKDKVKVLENDYVQKDKSLKEQLISVKIREDEAVVLLDKAKKEMDKAVKEMGLAVALRAEYEAKLRNLKSLV